MKSLDWMKIKIDSEPVFQSKNLAKHKKLALELYKKGFAYACDCSEETLTKMREEQIAKKQKPKYNGLNRDKNIELTGINKLISKPLKEKLKYDAQRLNFMKRTSKGFLKL